MKKTLAFVALAVALLFAGPSAQTSIGNFTRLIVDGRNAANVSVATVTLTDAQIKALPTTPVTLIAAPASGYRIKMLSGAAILDNNAGAYTNINAAYATVQIEQPAGHWLMMPLLVNDNTLTTPLAFATNMLGGTGHRVIDIGPLFAVPDAGATSGDFDWIIQNAFPLTTDVDAALVRIAADNNGSGNLTGGNAANTLKVTVYYIKEAL